MNSPLPVAVAIPCYNEAAAIDAVIQAWRQALPDGEIVVFDNNSTDDTAMRAQALGVRVVSVTAQGKGHAVQAIFATLGDRPAVILTDGDGTYPADRISGLLTPVLEGKADMAVGARRPVAAQGAMSFVRGVGNLLIPAAFYVLIGPGNSDLLSGYRVFSPHFLNEVKLRSGGFEIETELASEAVARGMKVVEVPVPYHPRIEGTVSKLRAFRDGRRILWMIFRQSVRLRPWRIMGIVGIGLAILGMLARSQVLFYLGATWLVAAIAPAAWVRAKTRR